MCAFISRHVEENESSVRIQFLKYVIPQCLQRRWCACNWVSVGGSVAVQSLIASHRLLIWYYTKCGRVNRRQKATSLWIKSFHLEPKNRASVTVAEAIFHRIAAPDHMGQTQAKSVCLTKHFITVCCVWIATRVTVLGMCLSSTLCLIYSLLRCNLSKCRFYQWIDEYLTNTLVEGYPGLHPL